MLVRHQKARAKAVELYQDQLFQTSMTHLSSMALRLWKILLKEAEAALLRRHLKCSPETFKTGLDKAVESVVQGTILHWSGILV